MLQKIVALLKSGQSKKAFFRHVTKIHPTTTTQYALIEEAYKDVEEAFKGDFRDSGEPYFEHPRGVALIVIIWLKVKDHNLIIAALLHDICEDHPELWTVDRVRKKYGKYVASLVKWLSEPPIETCGSKIEVERIYHGRSNCAPRGFFILKLPDRLYNLITLWGCTEEKRLKKIIETRLHYLPWAKKYKILHREMEEALEILESGGKIL